MTDPRHNPVPPPHPGPAPASPAPPTLGEPWQTQLDLPGGTSSSRGRVPRWVVALAAGTAVLSVVAFVTVLVWPRGEDGPTSTGPLAFHSFELAHEVRFDQQSRTAFTEMSEDGGYAAWEQGGDLVLVAVDVETGTQRWRQQVSGAARWGEVFSVPDAVIVVGLDESGPAQAYVHDAGDGHELWQADVSADDQLSATVENLVWYNAESGELRGVEVATGSELWTHPVSPDAATTWALTEEDLARPTNVEGDLGLTSTDHRLAVVGEDESAFVVDTRNGAVVSQAENIARPRDKFVAFEGRLYVARDEDGFQLVSYDLNQLSGLPQTHYRAGSDRYPAALEACTADRVCLLETQSFDRETTEAVVVDTAGGGGELWRQPVPGAEHLQPVGSWLVAVGPDGPVGFDAAGQEMVRREGVVARLNAENLLVFTGHLSDFESDISVAGIALEGERPVELGQISGVVGAQCSWRVPYLACPALDGAGFYRFAET